jgi:hypothetical protein
MRAAAALLVVVVTMAVPVFGAAVDYRSFDRLAAIIPDIDAYLMLARGDHLYLVGNGILQAWDISDTGHPVLASTISIGTDFRNTLSVDGDLMFLQSATETLLIGLADPLAPVIRSYLPAVGALALCGDYLICGTTAARVFDLHEPGPPVEMPGLALDGTLLGGWQDEAVVFREGYAGEAVTAFVESYPIADGTTAGPATVLCERSWYIANERVVFHPGRIQSFANSSRAVIPIWVWQFDVAEYDAVYAPQLPGADTGLRTTAENLLAAVPDQFCAYTDAHKYGALIDNDCLGHHLGATAVPGAPESAGSFDMPACTAGTVCGEGSRLYVARDRKVRIYEFPGRGFPDTVRLYHRNNTILLGHRTVGDGSLSWVEDLSYCASVLYPWGEEHWIVHVYALLKVELGANGTSVRRLVLPAYPAPDDPRVRPSDAVTLGDSITVCAYQDQPTPYGTSIQFKRLDEPEAYAVLTGLVANDLLVFDDAIIALDDAALHVIDASDRDNPHLVSTVPVPGPASSLQRWEHGVAVGTESGVVLVNLDDMSDGHIVSVVATNAPVTAIECAASTLMIAEGATVTFHDISDPESPIGIGAVTAIAPVLNFAVSGPFIYLACGEAGLLVYRRDSQEEASYLGGYPLDAVSDVVVQTNRLLVASSRGLTWLPLQDGDPLPAYAPQLTAAVDGRGDVILDWREPGSLAAGCRLERVCGAMRKIIPHTIVEGSCRAVDRAALESASQVYAVMISDGGPGWREVARVEVDLAAAAVQLLDPTPNPFNPSVAVRYRLSRASNIAIVVYDLCGRRVRQLVRQIEEAGTHETIWDGCDDAGHAVASGGYVARLEAEGQFRTTKLLLVR